MSSKFPEQSKTIQTDIVLPGDTNSLNNLFGGNFWLVWTRLQVLLQLNILSKLL